MTIQALSEHAAESELVVCEHCDAVYRRTPLAPKEKAYCPRCSTALSRDSGRSYPVLLPLALGRVPPGFGVVIRAIRLGRPWGMIEVFMLGIVAALVKLSTMATVVPGVALWSFGLLTILLTVVLSYDPAELWEQAEKCQR